MLEDWQGVHTPGILYECQNKGLTKLAFRKLLILNGAFSVDGSKRENTGERKNGTTASAGAGVNRRTPERRLPSEYDNRSGRVCQGKNRGSPYIVVVLDKQRISSNGRVRERKQRGRAHWGRGKWREGGCGRERVVILRL